MVKKAFSLTVFLYAHWNAVASFIFQAFSSNTKNGCPALSKPNALITQALVDGQQFTYYVPSLMMFQLDPNLRTWNVKLNISLYLF